MPSLSTLSSSTDVVAFIVVVATYELVLDIKIEESYVGQFSLITELIREGGLDIVVNPVQFF